MTLSSEYRRSWIERHPLYASWQGMKRLCGYIRGATRDESAKYAGIGICQEWADSYPAYETWCFENGWRKGLFVVRIDKDGDFGPCNCVIVPYCDAVNMRRNTTRVEGVPLRDIIGPGRGRGDREYRRAKDRFVKCGWDIGASVHPAVVPSSESGYIMVRVKSERAKN